MDELEIQDKQTQLEICSLPMKDQITTVDIISTKPLKPDILLIPE